ncbi:MAG: J domain-containing protein [Myxococcales bacterium]|nr:J domain-containing protein [Myxococcales bacterium]
MKVASGSVFDRPFARTISSLGAKRFTGDLIMEHKRRETKVVWSEGQIVAAHSSSPADSPGRQALTHGLVNSSTLGIFVQKMAEKPEQDAVALLAQLGSLSAQQCVTLKHHVLVRSATRIFGLADATFVVDNQPSLAVDPDLSALDARWLIYSGLRTHYSLERLSSELSAIGNRQISLDPEALPELSAFGFGEEEKEILARLQAHPMSLADLLSSGLDDNIASCVAYSLVACGYVKYGSSSETSSAAVPPPAVAVPAPVRKPRPTKSAAPEGSKRISSSQATVRGVGLVEPEESGSSKNQSAGGEETAALVSEKVRLLDAGGSHYEVLDLKDDAPDSDVRKSYFQLARRLHPDRLQALGLEGMEDDIQRVFAAINEAFKILSNPKELAHYKKVLAAGGEKQFAADQVKAEEVAGKIFEAEEHFRVGEMALRRDQFGTAETSFAKACELRPEESEYQALYAWALYCNSTDRSALEGDVMGKVSSALLKSPESVTTRLYHAKLLKLMGRSDEAVASFRKLLKMSPDHREGNLELRVLRDQESAASDAKGSKKGFFGR